MRDPKRLYRLYKSLLYYHRAYMPDIRFLQFMENIIYYIKNDLHKEPFYIEDEQIPDILSSYINTYYSPEYLHEIQLDLEAKRSVENAKR